MAVAINIVWVCFVAWARRQGSLSVVFGFWCLTAPVREIRFAVRPIGRQINIHQFSPSGKDSVSTADAQIT